MPNCAWYGSGTDHIPILDFIFAEETCDVCESYSQPGQPLKTFKSTQEVLNELKNTHRNGQNWRSVILQLRVLGCSPPLRQCRITLTPEKNNGATFRFAAQGAGLVQFYFVANIKNNALDQSFTNNFTEKGARGRYGYFDTTERLQDWDFDGIARFSGRLNRFIRKQKVAKLGSIVVLPEALDLWNSGHTLQPFHRDTHAEYFVGHDP